MGPSKTCLLVTNLFPPAIGGSSEVYAALAAHAGGEIAILTASHDYETGLERADWRARDRKAAYPVHRLRCIRPFLRSLPAGAVRYRLHEAAIVLTLAVTVIRLAWRYRVKAICIADDETVGWLAFLSRHFLRRRTLIYCHGDDLTGTGRVVVRRSRWFRLAHRIVAANRHAASLLTDRFGVAAEKIALIRNGVDLAVFCPGPAPQELVQRYQLGGRLVLLTVTRLVPRKGVDKVLEALPTIARQFPGALYLVVGEGPQRPELEEMTRKLGIASHVIFAGAVPHAATRDFYNAAQLVLLPNREEAGDADGLPLIFLEANACGKPVIGGVAGGTAEIVRDGENGFLVDGRDPGAIAQAVCGLLADEKRRVEMGGAGLAMAQGWGWALRTQSFLETCRD